VDEGAGVGLAPLLSAAEGEAVRALFVAEDPDVGAVPAAAPAEAGVVDAIESAVS